MKEVIEIPDGVRITKEDGTIIVSGARGEVKKILSHPHVEIKIDDKITIESKNERRKNKAVVGTWKAHIRNMIKGVTDGFKYEMKIVYTHFPITATVAGNSVEIKNFMGGKGIRKAKILDGVEVEIQKDTITLKGIDKEKVGQTAANIEQACRTRKKDSRIFQDGIYITRKG